MIMYKWVIKKRDKYFPIINNGAFRPFNNLNLRYYKKGNTIEGFINPYKLIKNGNRFKQRGFHRIGYHFWINKKGCRLQNYQLCMKRSMNNQINCILKCYVREKDIIMKSDSRVIAKKFRILSEEKFNEKEKSNNK